jgi:hypothetical protein
MDIHHVTREDLKHELPRGDEIDRIDGDEFDKLQKNRISPQGSNPLPDIPIHKKI